MPNPAPNIKDILSFIANDMQRLDEVIRSSLRSEVSLINQVSDYIINAGGKRLRPALVILMARALGANSHQMNQAIDVAAVVEFIHTATLLHDDVVDESSMRRGRLTANAQYGNSAAVLVGDFLYSRSFQMMVNIGLMDVMAVLSQTTNTIAQGEVLQLLNCQNPEVTEACYMQVIDFKTAKLFEACCQLACIVTGQNTEKTVNLSHFGAEIGRAFQLIDDVLDYTGESTELGKNVGDDLRAGKPTLPLIHAMAHAKGAAQSQIRQALANGGTQDVSAIMESIQQTQSLSYTRDKAFQLANCAKNRLADLTDTPFKNALFLMCDLAVNRVN